MRERILELAILQPNGYPWTKANLEMDKKEIDCILKELGLYKNYKRREVNKVIRFSILKETKNSNSNEEVIKQVRDSLKKYIKVNEDIIGKFQQRMNLVKIENIKQYNDFLQGKLNIKELESDIKSNLSWLVESLVIYFSIKKELTIEELKNNINEFVELLEFDNEYSKEINNMISLKGYNHDKSLLNLRKELLGYQEEVLTLFELIENRKSEEKSSGLTLDMGADSDINISDSIIDMFLSKPTSLDVLDLSSDIELDAKDNIKELSVEENKNEKLEKYIEEKVTKEEVLNEEGDELIHLSKEKYNKLIEADREREIKILKELSHIRNGAVLSELYNAYKNINDISKENLEIMLANLFNTLSSYGFEVIENGKYIGDDITVNTENVLKEFIFTNPVDKDGVVDGKVEYLGWSHNGKQVIPMVVKPL